MQRSRPGPPGFGEPAPFFTCETDGIPNYSIEVAAGRWIVLMVFGSLQTERSRRAHQAVLARRALFNDADAAFYGLSVDPKDRFERGLANAPNGLRYFWDFDRKVCRLFGYREDSSACVLLIDRSFRVIMSEPVEGVGAILDRLERELAGEPSVQESYPAPVLILPFVFEPEFCAALIDYFQAADPTPSGFAAEVEGRTVNLLNPMLKRRHDVMIEADSLLTAVRDKLETRLFPMVKRVFGWQATEIERYLLSRYGADEQGFFSAHRDDVTAGTAHRKFAVSLNLNAGAYEGGTLRFPEFGPRTYSPPTGGAAVFCCSLLHEVTPVTAGERYALLPFLYDQAGAKLKRENRTRVGEASGNRRDRRAAGARGGRER